MEPGRHTALARSGEREMGRVASSPTGPPRVRLRGGRRRHRRPVRAEGRGRRFRLAELGRARFLAAHMIVRLIALVLAFAVSAATTRAQEVDRTLPAQLSAPTRATLERLIDSAR